MSGASRSSRGILPRGHRLWAEPRRIGTPAGQQAFESRSTGGGVTNTRDKLTGIAFSVLKPTPTCSARLVLPNVSLLDMEVHIQGQCIFGGASVAHHSNVMMYSIPFPGPSGQKCKYARLVTVMKMSIILLGLTCHLTSVAEPSAGYGPYYRYRIEENHDADVCGHMGAVFNERFGWLWGGVRLTPHKEPSFAADGPYAFPRLPGVEHDDGMTRRMMLSKVPTSPEFEAIKWQEGRLVFGNPPESAGPQNNVPSPMLVAFFDFDNDGKIDTVIKEQFADGYNRIVYGGGAESDYIIVRRSEELSIGPLLSLWELRNPSNLSSPHQTPIVTAQYQRPFIYRGMTYVAQYSVNVGNWGGPKEAAPTTPLNLYVPHRESMSVLSYHLSKDKKALDGLPKWDVETICKFRMIQSTK